MAQFFTYKPAFVDAKERQFIEFNTQADLLVTDVFKGFSNRDGFKHFKVSRDVHPFGESCIYTVSAQYDTYKMVVGHTGTALSFEGVADE